MLPPPQDFALLVSFALHPVSSRRLALATSRRVVSPTSAAAEEITSSIIRSKIDDVAPGRRAMEVHYPTERLDSTRQAENPKKVYSPHRHMPQRVAWGAAADWHAVWGSPQSVGVENFYVLHVTETGKI